MMASDTEILHFQAIYEKKNLTKAAHTLKVTQPALTQSLLRLEGKLKTTLFIRTKQGCSPTPSAELLYNKATLLQQCWDDIQTSVQGLNEKLTGKFRLGCHPSLGAYTLPDFFKNLYEISPDIDIHLKHDDSQSLTQKIIDLEIDFAFVVNPLRHPDLILTKLGKDQILLWKNKSKSIPKIIYSDMPTDLLRRKLKNYSDWQFIETSSLELIRSLVRQGAGYGVIPERVARADKDELIQAESVVIQQDDIYLIYRVDTMKSAAAKAVIEMAKKSPSM